MQAHGLGNGPVPEEPMRPFVTAPAAFDAVTGLPNQMELERVLNERAIRQLPFGLMVVALPSLEQINQTLGHHVGDLVTATIGRRLTTVHPGAVVAPLSGGHFGIGLPEANSLADLHAPLKALQPLMDQDVRIGMASLRVPLQVGATLADAGTAALTALSDAETALLQARKRGVSHVVFETEMRHDTAWSLNLISDIGPALANGELTAFFQPQIDLRSGMPSAVEALARWLHPRHGVLEPKSCLGVIELSGLLSDFTERMLTAGVEAAVMLRDLGWPTRVSINVPMTVLRDNWVTAFLTDLASRSAIAPQTLMIEITETAFDDPTIEPTSLIGELRDAGFGVSLDDFGAGYSSLKRLADLNVTELKIDRALITPLERLGTKDHHIVRAIVEMAHDLELLVVAEGVELPVQEQLLIECGCDMAQGYLFGRAVSLDRLPSHMERLRAAARKPL